MKTRQLGRSGIEASVIAFGAWAVGGWMWGGNEEKESIAAIHAALDNGINLIDTAPVYGFGRSEEIVGKALKGRRHKAVVATKCALVWDVPADGLFHNFDATQDGKAQPGEETWRTVYRDGRAPAIRRNVEDSLRRLGTDVIDLIQTHWQDPNTPIAETMGELMQLKKEGKIRAIGCSNAAVEQMDQYRAAGQLDVDQEPYSMLDREHEAANLPYCQEHEVSFLAYSPLAQGLLTGKVGPDRVFAKGDARNYKPRFSLENREKVAQLLHAIQPIANDYRLTLSQLVAAWTIAQPGLTHALLGARNPKQVEENAKAGEVELAAEAIAQIREAIDRFYPVKQ
ncbi:MAG: aldo/keto reductase [Planctomycetes bacterium]|nr:aldo/keto reductase [Planctomycetota bacterium]